MQHPPNDGAPLRELKHDAVPGYRTAFLIAFAVMGLYLAVILITSPGSAKKENYPADPQGGAAPAAAP